MIGYFVFAVAVFMVGFVAGRIYQIRVKEASVEASPNASVEASPNASL